MTEVLDVVEFMADATDVPILMDGDTGYGHFNTFRRLVRRAESAGIAGVCIEDKCFPKTNSFIRGRGQPLIDIEQFCGKIRAGCDTRRDDEFVIVARTEAFIAGWGLDEALKRADAYPLAGADAILVHSASVDATQILAFRNEWENRLPVVVVPTKYYRTPAQTLRDAGISVAIWANHLMRASLVAMQRAAAKIKETEGLAGPVFIHVKIAAGQEGPMPRPTIAPEAVAERFRTWLRGQGLARA